MAVLDHAVHERTRQGEDARWGCWNRPPFAKGYYAPSGLVPAYAGATQMHVQMRLIPHVMTTECRNGASLTDLKCEGCEHRGSGEAHWEDYRRKLLAEQA